MGVNAEVYSVPVRPIEIDTNTELSGAKSLDETHAGKTSSAGSDSGAIELDAGRRLRTRSPHCAGSRSRAMSASTPAGVIWPASASQNTIRLSARNARVPARSVADTSARQRKPTWRDLRLRDVREDSEAFPDTA